MKLNIQFIIHQINQKNISYHKVCKRKISYSPFKYYMNLALGEDYVFFCVFAFASLPFSAIFKKGYKWFSHDLLRTVTRTNLFASRLF